VINKDWQDFKNQNGGFEGARPAFEKACETTFRKQYSETNVQQVAVKQGDGGIDIFIGKLSIEPIIVIQCKFFLDIFENSQKQQITKSFITAITSTSYTVKEWILCIPKILSLDEHQWWNTWAAKQVIKYSLPTNSIKLINGSELIDKMKELNIYQDIFDVKESLQIIKTGQQVEAILNILSPKTTSKIQTDKLLSDTLINEVLFYNYKEPLDRYYLIRNHDHLFSNQLKKSHLWISGKSGSGKTVTINRNLITAKTSYIFCDLSPTVINCSDDVFKEVYFELAEYLNIPAEQPNNILKQLTKMMIGVNEAFVIVIDELSIPNEAVFLELTDKIVRLINHYTNKVGSDCVRFVISTINKPKTTEFNRSKAAEYFDFILIDEWESDIKRLYDLIEENLSLTIPEDSYKYIIGNCLNSPRYLKNILKKVTSLSELTHEKIVEMTDKAKMEFI
jgi:hypothetical protein